MKRLWLLVALSVALIAGCGSDGGDDDGDLVTMRILPPTQVSELLAAGGHVLVDVRTPAEFTAGHLAGATLVDYEAGDFEARIGDLPRDDRYVVYCASGRRSQGAADVMHELGFTDVVQIDGGIDAWTAAGLPVEQ